MSDSLYGAFASGSFSSTLNQLLKLHIMRTKFFPPPSPIALVRTPVLLVFSRGDRAGNAKNLTDQITASLPYWDRTSGDSIDLVLAGWSKVAEVVQFNLDEFITFKEDIEGMSSWRFSGETDLLLLNLVVSPEEKTGYFEFKSVVTLPIEEMIRDKLIGSIDQLVEELLCTAKSLASEESKRSENPTWELSDRIGMRWGKKALWDSLLSLLLKGHSENLKKISALSVRDFSDSREPEPFKLGHGGRARVN